MGLKKHYHITQTMKELHWLPVEARSTFYILTLTWRAHNNKGLTYIKDLLKVTLCRPSILSHNTILLDVTYTNLIGCGNVAFCKTAPGLSNKLTEEVNTSDKKHRYF